MINYKLIADSIPAAEMAAAIAAIGPDKAQQTFEVDENKKLVLDQDGNAIKIDQLDNNGDPIMLPGGFSDLTTVEAAFDAIKNLSGLVSRGEFGQSYRGIARDAGFGISSQFEISIKAAVTVGDLPGWAHDALNNGGVNINDPDVAAKLNSFVTDNNKHGFDRNLVDAVLATGSLDTNTFPGLKLGHVRKSIVLRGKGKI